MPPMLPGLFEGVNSVDASSATRRFQVRTVEGGEVVLSADRAGRSLVGVLSGALEVRLRDVVLARVGPGELVGEMALFETSQRTADVIANGPGEVVLISRNAYEELRDTAHPVAANLERMLMAQQASRLREMDERIARLAHGEARPRRLPGQDFLARVAAEFGRGGMFSSVSVDRVAALRASGLVGDIPGSILEEMADHLEVEVCGAGELLCAEGSLGDKLWLVESGTVDVLVATELGEVQNVASLGPGSLVGAAALVDGGARMASCIASSRLISLSIDRERWDELEGDCTLWGSALRRAVIRALSTQLSGANAMVERFEVEQATADLDRARSRLVANAVGSQAAR